MDPLPLQGWGVQRLPWCQGGAKRSGRQKYPHGEPPPLTGGGVQRLPLEGERGASPYPKGERGRWDEGEESFPKGK